MIHQVLLSLWNCPDELFKEYRIDDFLDLEQLQEFLHPGECKLLQRIIKISFSYHEIEEFRTIVNNQDNFDDITMENYAVAPKVVAKSGRYLIAFCKGLDEVLGGYRNEIIRLEKTILENPKLTLTYILSSVEKYVTLFDALKSMIRTIDVGKIYGCLLMGRLHSYTNCGLPIVVDAANIIIASVNIIFYRQLSNWIVYGDLVDLPNEFFICDGKCDDEDFLFPEQIETNSDEIKHHPNFVKKSSIRRPCRVRKFSITTSMLPSILPLNIAETILFMGRVVWIIRNDPKINYDNKKKCRDIWEGESELYYQEIQQLEKNCFNISNFTKTIEKCRLKLTKYLWAIMVEESNLLEHLQLLRDYYALGRGELFQQFIVIAEEQLIQTPNDYIVKNLNFIFTDTARKMYTERDHSYTKFELAMPRNLTAKEYASNPWSHLEIYFDVHWPLHIIFHPKVMALYNKLFGFLLRVKKTHIDLHTLWLSHMEGKGKIDRGIWRLRHSLMFLVNNLQYYLQVDVIEANFSLLKESIKSANEFNDIIRLHSTFLSNLLSKTFVMSLDEKSQNENRHSLYQVPALHFDGKNMVYNIILLLLELCDEFCLIAKKISEPERDTLDDLQTRADLIVESLLRALNSLHEQVSGNHILQLLHRLDFNRWFTKTKPDLNITVYK